MQADSAGDLTITVSGDPGDSITVANDLTVGWWGGATSRVTQLDFANGTTMAVAEPTWNTGQTLTFTWVGTPVNTTLTGSGFGSNVFDLGTGGDTVTFGNGSQGGSNQNTVVFNEGDGAVRINPNGGYGTIGFDAGITASNLLMQADSAGDLTIALSGDPGDSITVANDLTVGWWGGATSRVTQLDFANGTTMAVAEPTWNTGQTLAFTWVGTAVNTALTGSGYGSNVFDLGTGGDTVTFGNGSQGGSNQNTVVFNEGDGAVKINPNGGYGTIEFGAGITASNLLMQADSAGDLTIALSGDPGDSITVANDLTVGWWGGATSRVTQLDFANGTTMAVAEPTWNTGQTLTFTWVGTAVNTALTGSGFGSNVFDLGMGGDTVTFGNGSQGGSNQNTVVFNEGDGSVTINPNGGAGVLDFGPGISAQQLWFIQNNANLTVDVLGTSDQVTVENWFGGSPAPQSFDFVTSSGLQVGTGVSQLVTAMAAYANSNPGFSPATASALPPNSSVQNAIAAAWHQ